MSQRRGRAFRRAMLCELSRHIDRPMVSKPSAHQDSRQTSFLQEVLPLTLTTAGAAKMHADCLIGIVADHKDKGVQ